MDDLPATHARRRIDVWIMWSAVGAGVLALFAVVSWFWLPRWCPEQVARWSPWVDPVVRAVTSDSDTDRGIELFAQRIEQWGESAALPLCGYLVADGDQKKGSCAVIGLNQLGGHNLPREAVNRMIAATAASGAKWREELFYTLGRIESPEIASALINLIRTGDVVTRRYAQEALDMNLNRYPLAPDGVRLLAIAAGDVQPEVRSLAIKHLQQFDEIPEARAAIIAGLTDPIRSVRASAVEKAGYNGIKEAVPQLIGLLNDEELRPLVAVALGHLGDRTCVPALIGFADDRRIEVRREVAYALGELGDPAATTSLMKAASDSDPGVAGKGRDGLRLLRAPAAKALFIGELAHSEAVRRAQAIEALSGIGGDDVWGHLLNGLGDRKVEVRIAAVVGMGRLGDERAIPLLLKAVTDSDRVLRLSAARSLGSFRDERIAPLLIAGLESGSLRADQRDMRTKSPLEQEIFWHNAVLDAIEKQALTEAQRNSLPARRTVPPAKRYSGFSLFR